MHKKLIISKISLLFPSLASISFPRNLMLVKRQPGDQTLCVILLVGVNWKCGTMCINVDGSHQRLNCTQ